MTIYFNNKCYFHTTTVLTYDTALNLTVSLNIKTPVACIFSVQNQLLPEATHLC